MNRVPKSYTTERYKHNPMVKVIFSLRTKAET